MQISAVFNSVVGRTGCRRPTGGRAAAHPVGHLAEHAVHGLVTAWRGARPGDLVISGMVQSSIVVPLVPAGTERNLPRQNMLNLSFQKIARVNNLELRPQLEIYNATNASTHYSERSANYGTPSYGIPRQMLLGRMLRLSMQLLW